MSVVKGLKIQIHVCGTYVLSVWFTLLIGFGNVWIFSRILVPTSFDKEAPFELHHLNLFSPPTSLGGLGIPFLKDEATQQYAASSSLTSAHVESVVAQDVELRETNCDKKIRNQLYIYKIY